MVYPSLMVYGLLTITYDNNLNHIIMKLLSRSYPKRKSVTYTIVLGVIISFFVLSYILYYFDYLFYNNRNFNFIEYLELFLCIFLGFIVEGVVVLYFVGDVLWQTKGEEILFYDTNFLYIINKGRIIGKSKKIRWSSIKGAGLINLTLYQQLVVYFSVSGTIEEQIQITRYRGRKIYCGVNLSKNERDKVVANIQKMVNINQAKINSSY